MVPVRGLIFAAVSRSYLRTMGRPYLLLVSLKLSAPPEVPIRVASYLETTAAQGSIIAASWQTFNLFAKNSSLQARRARLDFTGSLIYTLTSGPGRAARIIAGKSDTEG